jgi:tetratricopeptide (TPR) repeat protein
MGRFDEALDTYRQASDRFPYEPVALNGYAVILREVGDFDTALQLYEEAISRFPHDVWSRNGRAKALKLAGRFEDSLQAYDQNVRDFPYDLYSLIGRADLLKELGYHIEALKAYDVIIERRPDYVDAKYAKAAVLVILRRYADAEALLPAASPKTHSEWIAYHIRGMIFLKKGLLQEALTLFTTGVLLNPFYRERQYFENALAIVKIRLKEFAEAAKIASRTVGPIAQILRMHAYCASGNREEAATAYKSVNDNWPTPLLALRDEVAARYGLIDRAPRFTDEWIFEREADVMLEAA